MTLEEHKQQELFVKENLKKGYIWPSRLPMASPFFFVNKKDGKLQPTQDYQYLNQWTIKNTYPLLLISEIMDKIKASGAKYFTKFDVQWGFNNIHIKDGDKGRIGSYTKLCNFTLLFMILQVELWLNKGSLVRPRLVGQVKVRAHQ